MSYYDANGHLIPPPPSAPPAGLIPPRPAAAVDLAPTQLRSQSRKPVWIAGGVVAAVALVGAGILIAPSHHSGSGLSNATVAHGKARQACTDWKLGQDGPDSLRPQAAAEAASAANLDIQYQNLAIDMKTALDDPLDTIDELSTSMADFTQLNGDCAALNVYTGTTS
jgi:hypothetical protein